MRRLVFALVALCLFSAAAAAQTVNPQTVEFTASVDHNAVVNTVTILTNYAVEVYTPTGTTPVKAIDIGKPTPSGANLVTWNGLRAVLDTVAAGDYVVKVASVGPGGAARTPASDPFTVSVRSPAAAPKPAVR